MSYLESFLSTQGFNDIKVYLVPWPFFFLSQLQKDFEEPSLAQLKLKDFKVGERLGQSSSNSAVYSAEYMGHEVGVL